MKNIICLLILMLFLLTGCGSYSSELKKDSIIYGGLTDPASLNPLFGTDAVSSEVQSIIFNPLVNLQTDSQVKPALARSWQISADGKKYVFHLYNYVFWHDGQPFSADDVIFTFNKIKEPYTACDYAGEFQNIKEILKLNDYTVEFQLQKRDAAFLARLSSVFILPKHLLQGEEDLRTSRFNEKPIGTGPFKFIKRKKAEYLAFEAYDFYHLKPAKIKKFYYKIIPQSNVLALQLQKGEIDVGQVDIASYYNLSHDARIKLYKFPGQAYTYIAWNIRKPLLTDAKVRKALALAYNREYALQYVLNGHGYLATADLPSCSFAYNPDLSVLPYDPQKALQLLAEAGWSRNLQGYLQKNGQIFKFTLLLSNSNKTIKDLAIAFQSDLKKIGVQVDLLTLDFNVLREKRLFKYDFTACFMSQKLSSDPDFRWVTWHSSQSAVGLNFSGLQNSEIDRLFAQGRDELNWEKRQKIYQRVEKILYEEQPYLFLYYPEVLLGQRINIGGISQQRLGPKDNIFWNITDWEIK